jgi:hypothetical protein
LYGGVNGGALPLLGCWSFTREIAVATWLELWFTAFGK